MVAVSALIGLLATYGVPVILKIVQGDKAGAVNTVIKAVADKLGVEPTEAAIVKAEKEDPGRFNEVIQTVEIDFAAMAESASDATQSYHKLLMQDQQSGLLSRTWRPFNGYIFGINCSALVFSFVYCMMTGQASVITAAAAAFGFLGTVLSAHAAVVGVYTWRRTTEKIGNNT